MIYLLKMPENSRKQDPYVLIEAASDKINYQLFKKAFTTTSQIKSKYGAFVKLNEDQQYALNNEKYAIYSHSFQFLKRGNVEYTIIESLDELPQSQSVINDGTCGYCDGCVSQMNWCDNQ